MTLAAALLPASATAETARPALPATLGGAHVLVHYDPATASAEYAAAGLADFEEAYSRLVAGGGGTPNAGLRAPVNDAPRGGDGRVDVYLAPPASDPNFVGGEAVGDGATLPDPHTDTGFLYMTPSQARPAFRFRAAHELMHVIEDAYVVSGSLLTEATANWAADMALPDVEPGDSQFTVPFLPFTCAYGAWKTIPCGNGYRQWPFFTWLTERYGLGFMHRLWMRHRTDCLCSSPTTSMTRTIIDHAITDEPGDWTLATSYADYIAALWDPTRWTTTALDHLHATGGVPVTTDAALSRATPTRTSTTTVDHLATRYLRVLHGASSAPGDQVRLTVTTPPTDAAPLQVLSGTGPGRARATTPMVATAPNTYAATVSLDGATVTDVVIPLINTGTSDDLPFTWRAELLPAGVPAGPANDERGVPLRIQPRTTTTLDIAAAGGLGSTEAPDCPSSRAATRGTWFIVLVDKGPLTVDARGSDFDAAVAVYDVTLSAPYLWSCSSIGASGGLVGGETMAREYLIYVGRASTAAGTGHTLRLTVDANVNTFGASPIDDVTPPVITSARLSRTRFRAARSGGPLTTKPRPGRGSQLTFTVSEASFIAVAFERRTTGRLVGGTCVKRTTRNRSKRRCDRYVASGSAGLDNLRSGAVTLNLTGRRSAKRALAPGTYRLRLTATDIDDNRSAPVLLPFTIRR